MTDLNILRCIQSGCIAPVLLVTSQDISRVGGLACGQLLSKSFMPGIAERGHLDDPIFGSVGDAKPVSSHTIPNAAIQGHARPSK